MIPPQCGIETIGARPRTLPLRITSMIFWSVLNSEKKSAPESGGIVLSGDDGFGTPPRPFGPWHCAHANWLKSCAPSATRLLTLLVGGGVVDTVTVTVFVDPQAVRRSAAAARVRAERSIRRCYGAGAALLSGETT